MLMRANRSLAIRAFGLASSLVTVWCLGCSAFDPLLSRLAGSNAGMNCASGTGGMSGAAMVAAAHTPVASVSAVPAANAPDVGCDCQGCFAPSLHLGSIAVTSVLPPGIPDLTRQVPADIAYQPLHPPPQAHASRA